MEDKQRKYLDKVVEFLVRDTNIDYENNSLTSLLHDSYPTVPLSYFLTILSTYPPHVFPSLYFSIYCKDTYGLTDDEISYVWKNYRNIIVSKIKNKGSINESMGKLDKFYTSIINDLIKRTKIIYFGDQIGIIFPFYTVETTFFYTEEEIEEWYSRRWHVGKDTCEYLMDHYGVIDNECQYILTEYGKKISIMVNSNYGRR